MSIRDDDAGHFFDSLHQCRISVMDNKEGVIVSACAEREDVVCILSGTYAPCLLRPDRFENWTLLSGDCYIFGDSIRVPSSVRFLSDEFIQSHAHLGRDFRIRYCEAENASSAYWRFKLCRTETLFYSEQYWYHVLPCPTNLFWNLTLTVVILSRKYFGEIIQW